MKPFGECRDPFRKFKKKAESANEHWWPWPFRLRIVLPIAVVSRFSEFPLARGKPGDKRDRSASSESIPSPPLLRCLTLWISLKSSIFLESKSVGSRKRQTQSQFKCAPFHDLCLLFVSLEGEKIKNRQGRNALSGADGQRLAC